MIGDGQTYLWIPSMLSLSTLSAEAVAVINAVHTAIGRPTVTIADQNPYVLLLNDLDMGGAPFTRDAEPGMAVCGPIRNLDYLPLDYVALIVAFGGDIEGMPVFFEIDDPTAVCPFSETGDDWNTWGVFGESHKPVQYGEKWYRSTAVGASGTLLNASQWVGYRQGGGVVLTVAEYQAIQQANASE